LGGGGKSKSLKKIYRPHAIFKKFDPPCPKVALNHEQGINGGNRRPSIKHESEALIYSAVHI